MDEGLSRVGEERVTAWSEVVRKGFAIASSVDTRGKWFWTPICYYVCKGTVLRHNSYRNILQRYLK